MSQDLRDFSLPPTARLQWRRALDELLIDAIFGKAPPAAFEHDVSWPAHDEEQALQPVLVAAE